MGMLPSPEERIQHLQGELSPKQARLARFILENKYFVSVASAQQVGEEVGVSAATVVRLAQRLGYDGFTELQEALRQEFPRYLTTVERTRQRLASPLPSDDVPAQVFRTDIQNIERTAQNLDPEHLDAVVEEIARASNILVIGGGLSAAPATFMVHSLKVMGFNVRGAFGGGMDVAAEVAQLDQDTLVIAIDVWRYLRTTVQALTTAHKRGARTIAITDSALSPLAQAADYTFEVATEGVAHSLSPTAIIALINVIIARLSFHLPEKTMEALQRVDEAYRENHLLIVEG